MEYARSEVPQKIVWLNEVKVLVVSSGKSGVRAYHIVLHLRSSAPIFVDLSDTSGNDLILSNKFTLMFIFSEAWWSKKVDLNLALQFCQSSPVEVLFYKPRFNQVLHLHEARVLIRHWLGHNFLNSAVRIY